MKAIQHLLHRSLVALYYRQNAGLFLFLFFFLFGTQPSFGDLVALHYSLVKSILTSSIFYFITLAIWLIYSLKVIVFIINCIKKESYDFLYLLNELQPQKRFFLFLQLTVQLLAPVLVYGSIVLMIGAKEQLWMGFALIATTLLILLLIATSVIYFLTGKGKATQEINSRKSILSIALPAGLFRFCVAFIFKQQFISLLITKVLSFGSLYFISRTEPRLFEDRMLWLVYSTVLIGHSFLIYRLFNFQETQLSFCRNLPVRRSHLLLTHFLLYGVLLLPEAWALLGVAIQQQNWQAYAWMLASGPAVLIALYSLLYTEDMKIEEFLKLIFGVWIVLVFFSLSQYRWLIPVVFTSFGAIVFYISYYRYEKSMETEGIE